MLKKQLLIFSPEPAVTRIAERETPHVSNGFPQLRHIDVVNCISIAEGLEAPKAGDFCLVAVFVAKNCFSVFIPYFPQPQSSRSRSLPWSGGAGLEKMHISISVWKRFAVPGVDVERLAVLAHAGLYGFTHRA